MVTARGRLCVEVVVVVVIMVVVREVVGISMVVVEVVRLGKLREYKGWFLGK